MSDDSTGHGQPARGGPNLDARTIVVWPSLSFPPEELRKIIGVERYEERLLCFALMLSDPDLRMVYGTSMPIDDAVVDYYLSFLPEPEHAGARLELFAIGDPEQRGLSSKLLERPADVERLRALIGDDYAYMVPFNVTEDEARLAGHLGLPVYGVRPDLVHLGSKSGAKGVARTAGVAVLAGAEDLFSVAEVEAAIANIRKARPDAGEVVIKLNNGFSGQGNAVVGLQTLRSPLIDSPTVFCAHEESWISFARKIEAEGAIVEEMARAEGLVSPSVQMRVLPGGIVEEISTHDQILGGPDDQVYLGCRFPAAPAYRGLIAARARAVGEVLASQGVIGPFGIDFVVMPKGDGFDVFLSEINLRMGGTTHPFFMARAVTDSAYDLNSGELVAGGRAKHYVATDNLKSPTYVGLEPRAVLEGFAARGLLFDPATATGATLHLLGALHGYGKLGVLCIADSRAAAHDLYADCVEALDDIATDKPA